MSQSFYSNPEVDCFTATLMEGQEVSKWEDCFHHTVCSNIFLFGSIRFCSSCCFVNYFFSGRDIFTVIVVVEIDCSYDHPNIIAGHGTMGLEIIEQVPDLDAVLVPVGGGGLIAGVALAIKSLHPDVLVYVI